jgi:signal transduction histidine kinase
VLTNLIGNALQYSPADSTITIRIVGEADQVSVSVHNDGEPIPPDEQKSIFKPLTRGAGAANERSAKLGLGLFITQKIVAAHGGDIRTLNSRRGNDIRTDLAEAIAADGPGAT